MSRSPLPAIPMDNDRRPKLPCTQRASRGRARRCKALWLVLGFLVGVASAGTPQLGASEQPAGPSTESQTPHQPHGERPADPPSLAQVQAILAAHCVECHNPKKRSGGLNLSTPDGLARGGDSGEAIVRGSIDESVLWQRVEGGDMPPDERPSLSEAERAVLRTWIAAGARDLAEPTEGPDHWAFRSPECPPPPAVRDASRVLTDVDRFVQAALEQHGLSLTEEAPRAVLIRRVSYLLTGLPPTPAEVAAFVDDGAPQAYERMVDRYLASPRYGERWGKHWLDVAGYADSNGYFNADSDRPLAYRYRDWVIRSVNDDRPLDEFLRLQLAGDELVGYQPGGDVTPEVLDALVATHFLRNAQDGTGESDGNDDEVRADRYSVIEGTVQILGSALLGLTVQCARCHDHKFEPLTQREYYQLQAILLPAYCPDQWRKPAERVVEIGTVAERTAHEQACRQADEERAALERQRDERRAELVDRLVSERLDSLPADEQAAVLAARAVAADQRDEDQQQLLAAHAALLEVDDEALTAAFADFAAEQEAAQRAIDQVEAQRPAPLETVALLTDVVSEPPVHHLLERGNYNQPGDEVPPDVPAWLSGEAVPYDVAAAGAHSGSGRRAALARWLTAPGHPTVARLEANRIWQQLLGQGIVATPENFGYTGADPTHPELLDYLACELRAQGYHRKALVRLIVCSAVFRQVSDPRPAALEVDPENALCWRFAPRRLDAEAIRDAMLAVAGELDATMFGPYVPTRRAGDGSVDVAEDVPGWNRRSVYLQQRRTQVATLLELFDAPSMVTNCTRRPMSTIALQSLALLNSQFVVGRGAALAARVADEIVAGRAGSAETDHGCGGDAQQGTCAVDLWRLERAFNLALAREPSAGERATALEFLTTQSADYRAAGRPESEAHAQAWADLCQMLLASNAFLYLD